MTGFGWMGAVGGTFIGGSIQGAFIGGSIRGTAVTLGPSLTSGLRDLAPQIFFVSCLLWSFGLFAFDSLLLFGSGDGFILFLLLGSAAPNLLHHSRRAR